MKFVQTFLLSFFVLANMARANTFGSDMTDLWWNANESGWGVTATHQGDVVFLTFFVYGMDNRPTFIPRQLHIQAQRVKAHMFFPDQCIKRQVPGMECFSILTWSVFGRLARPRLRHSLKPQH